MAFMAKELAKTYEPKEVEDKIYRSWEESGFFAPEAHQPRADNLKSAKPFTIIMPPPNANGALHIGHAVFVTLQDIMVRFERMRGRKTLWLPGADHAGFETQVVFDKKLEKEGRNRFQIPRDQLFREMWDFTQANKRVMENQLRKLGASCDWSREKFTLDPEIVETVKDTFHALYEDGLLYRGERIVNWCVKHQTTLSDLEVKYEERSDPLYYIKYGPFELATVRPETKFGDTAVAVHPTDKRFKKYIGKELEIETLLGPAKIKVIGDSAVDPKFGTGVIKVTPAHDPTDFEIGKRHKLEVRSVIGKDGKLNEKTGPYAGLKVAEARKKVAEDMQARGLIIKIDEQYTHNVSVCYKCGNVVEPMVMPQWFVKMEPLAKKAIAAVETKQIQFIPERTKKVYFHWLKNIRDWNISRQISWGIRIPAWYCIGCGDIRMKPKIKGNWYFVRHGETDWNAERRIQGQSADAPGLNEKGRAQAKEAAEQLKTYNIDLILASDLRRTRETAEIVGHALNKEVFIDSALRERNYGEYEGKTRDELRIIYPDFETEHGGNPPGPGGESYEELEKRVFVALAHHRNNHAERNVAIVTHGAWLRALLRKVRNLSHQAVREIPVHNAAVFHVAISDPCGKCGSDFVEQDPDVLDTWFSSGQWPYATLLASGRKKQETRNSEQQTKTKNQGLKTDFGTFYPTDVMETGYDILFFWVARMIMLGLYRTGKVPFKTVYLHGLVRDKDRQKMSKSKGNVIDPLGVAEQYGTDAVRMALTVGNLPGNDIIISEEKIRGYRNFANKLWNIHRFIVTKSESIENIKNIKIVRSSDDKKRLKELSFLTKIVTQHLEKFEFHHAAEKLYHYTWHTFADKIIEETKPRLQSSDARERARAESLLLEIHRTVLKLLHPFMPFVTEALWQDLQKSVEHREKRGEKRLLMVEPWPSSK